MPFLNVKCPTFQTYFCSCSWSSSLFFIFILESDRGLVVHCHFKFVRSPQIQYPTIPSEVDRLTRPTRCPMTLLWLLGIGRYILSTAFAILHIREGDNADRLQSNSKKPLFTFQWAREKSPPQCRALLGEGGTAKCVYLSTQFQLYFERRPKLNVFGPSAPRLLSNRIMLHFFFFPTHLLLIFHLSLPYQISCLHLSQTEMRKLVVQHLKIMG